MAAHVLFASPRGISSGLRSALPCYATTYRICATNFCLVHHGGTATAAASAATAVSSCAPAFSSSPIGRGNSELGSGPSSWLVGQGKASNVSNSEARGVSDPAPAGERNDSSALLRHLVARTKIQGPLSVADYMKECLTNPVGGYYMNRDVFGERGDFVTSPEISQMFGELVAVWMVTYWKQCGAPPSVQVVEVGPGRGTMAADMVRTFARVPDFARACKLRLVEASPAMRALQLQSLGAKEGKLTRELREAARARNPDATGSGGGNDDHLPAEAICQAGDIPVGWYRHLADVPRGLFTIVVAHEFFDALPVHHFERTGTGWREKLVTHVHDNAGVVGVTGDVTGGVRGGGGGGGGGADKLQFVIAKQSTLAASAFTQLVEDQTGREAAVGTQVEVSPESWLVMEEMAKRVSEDCGATLVVDYGKDRVQANTLRAIRDHKMVDPLESPGNCDLTADVDFRMLKRAASKFATARGPIPQGAFLQMMGMQLRLRGLLKKASSEEHGSQLIESYRRLVEREQMGEIYKVMAVTPQDGPVPFAFTPEVLRDFEHDTEGKTAAESRGQDAEVATASGDSAQPVRGAAITELPSWARRVPAREGGDAKP